MKNIFKGLSNQEIMLKLIHQYGLYVKPYYDYRWYVSIIDMYGNYNTENYTSYSIYNSYENNKFEFKSFDDVLKFGIDKASEII